MILLIKVYGKRDKTVDGELDKILFKITRKRILVTIKNTFNSLSKPIIKNGRKIIAIKVQNPLSLYIRSLPITTNKANKINTSIYNPKAQNTPIEVKTPRPPLKIKKADQL